MRVSGTIAGIVDQAAFADPSACVWSCRRTKDLDTAGVLTLHPELLAKGCTEMTPADVLADIEELEQARFVVVDDRHI
jgi:hypothetical protein